MRNRVAAAIRGCCGDQRCCGNQRWEPGRGNRIRASASEQPKRFRSVIRLGRKRRRCGVPDSHIVLVLAMKKREFSSAIPSRCCSATVDFFRAVLILVQCSSSNHDGSFVKCIFCSGLTCRIGFLESVVIVEKSRNPKCD
jgi:hypothetical protein